MHPQGNNKSNQNKKMWNMATEKSERQAENNGHSCFWELAVFDSIVFYLSAYT